MKSGFLVLGMHRSGTSAVTGCLPPFGVELGPDLMPSDARNAKGFFESRRVCALMERFLADCGSFWHDWRPLDLERVSRRAQRDLRRDLTAVLRDEFKYSAMFAVKDPRNCRLVPLWLSVLADLDVDPAIVIALRHPICVARSLSERNGMSFDKSLFLWLRHMLDAERETRSCRRTFIPYDDILADWRPQLTKIGALLEKDWSIVSDKRDRLIECHLDNALRHYVPDASAAALMNAVGPWFDDAWRALSACAHEDGRRDSAAMLDAINADFTAAGRHFSFYFADVEAELHRLRGEKTRPYREDAASLVGRSTEASAAGATPKADLRLTRSATHALSPPRSGIAGFTNFVIVRSWDGDTATVRMQSDPILSGLLGSEDASVSVHVPGTGELALEPATCLIYHHDDMLAVQSILAARPRPAGCLTICLGADLYSYSGYSDVHDMVDLYIMPSELHRQVLQAQVFKPVYYLPECVDPIGIEHDRSERAGPPIIGRKRVLWFGYADSFYKSMASLLPTIDQSLRSGIVDSFTLITNELEFNRNYRNHFEFPIIPYNGGTFVNDVSAFEYCILSHFPLDLSLNTYVKSPNKLITALCAGLIPIVSDTPNYRNILERFQLQRLLFSSPAKLETILKRLNPAEDRRLVQESGAANTLREERSQENVFAEFIEILKTHTRHQTSAGMERLMTHADATAREAPPRGAIANARRAMKRLHLALHKASS